MALADPQVITVNSVAKSMPRVETSGRKSLYATDDGLFSMTVSHQTTAQDRIRSLAGFEQRAVVTNPLDSTDQDYDSLRINVTFDRPSYGFSLAQVQQLTAAIVAKINDAFVAQIFGQQS